MCVGTGMGAAAVIENEQLWVLLRLWSVKTLVKFNFLPIIILKRGEVVNYQFVCHIQIFFKISNLSSEFNIFFNKNYN
jgi:hypothetical protein